MVLLDCFVDFNPAFSGFLLQIPKLVILRCCFVLDCSDVTLWVTIWLMIVSFIHKILERFYKTGKTSGIQANHAKKLRLILSNLDQAVSADARITVT